MEILNGHFADQDDYFRQATEFLLLNHWIYKSPNTHILVDNIIDFLPKDWIISDVEGAIKGQSQVKPHFFLFFFSFYNFDFNFLVA